MDLKQYRKKLIGSKEERAVSPVIGVILMVAITVILAAVIAAFVLDMGDMGGSAPNAQFEWSINDGGEVIVTLTSGEDVDASNLDYSAPSGVSTDGDGDLQPGDDDTWSAGEEIHFDGSASGDYEITWSSDGNSAILTDHEE